MLNLKNITKNYYLGDEEIAALRGVTISFRKSEFVSILGPSGCGKTTLLNIIGGLDKYSSGDLLVEGKSTSEFTDSEWDAYRNGAIGFVFQNYNLISHFNVLDNVAIALSLSGVSAKERNERSKSALIEVGLGDQLHKRPNQLSGGQMQRVAIARALVNNPKILLADEPTGALDSQTSIQIMDLLRKISKDRLVIMVTHNGEIANNYSDRIIRVLDGMVIEDSAPFDNEVIVAENVDNIGDVFEENTLVADADINQVGNDTKKSKKKKSKIDMNKPEKAQTKKTSMSFMTALKSSFKNLLTKKARTVLTAVAGSIGIIGVALVLSLSNGMKTYISTMQSDTLAGFPISVQKTYMSMDPNAMMDMMSGENGAPKFPSDNVLHSYEKNMNALMHQNNITQEYVNYILEMDKTLYNSISFNRAVALNMVTQNSTANYQKVTSRNFSELPDNRDFIMSQYELLGDGRYPATANEALLIVDERNNIDVELLKDLGYEKSENYAISDFIGKQLKVVMNNDFYSETNGRFSDGTDYEKMYENENSLSLQIVGVMRVKENASSAFLSSGIAYTVALTEEILNVSATSDIVVAQSDPINRKINVKDGTVFINDAAYREAMQKIGGDSTPVSIQIYPVSFDTKDGIKKYLNEFNTGKEDKNKILYMDLAETISSMITTYIDVVSIVLVAFAAISLVVSSIMIGIITYVSVVERTKEIGIMRAIGARKKDISRIFNAETVLIGFVAGTIGVLLCMLLCFPITALATSLIGMPFKVSLPIPSALILIVISMALTFIAGLIPARVASKKDPVVALRAE